MPQNKTEVIKHRRMRVAEMYLAGKWQTTIASEVGVSQSQVSQDLAVLRRLWQQSALVDMDRAKARELAKLDRLETEYWRAWDLSLQPETKKSSKDRTGDDSYHETQDIETSVSGNPQFLHGIFNCISKRCEIFGLNAPFKIDATSKGKSMQQINIIVDSPETKDEYQKLIEVAENKN